jgi:hypothetical protein
MAGQVHHDGAAHGLSREASARSPWQDRHAELGRGGNGGHYVVGVPGKNHAERLDRVHAGIAGKQVTAVRVEPHLAAQGAAQRDNEVTADGHASFCFCFRPPQ